MRIVSERWEMDAYTHSPQLLSFARFENLENYAKPTLCVSMSLVRELLGFSLGAITPAYTSRCFALRVRDITFNSAYSPAHGGRAYS